MISCDYNRLGYTCPEIPVEKSNKCMFHDEMYIHNSKNRKIVQNRFYRKFNNMIDSKKNPLECVGYILQDVKLVGNIPIDVNFIDITFKGESDFKKSVFEGRVDFEECVFEEKMHFESHTFVGDVNFKKSTFKGIAYFWNSTFGEEVNFEECVFKKEAYFWNSTFGGLSYFKRCVFKGVNFSGSTFVKKGEFSQSVFEEEVNFSQIIFEKEVNFERSKFKGDTDFKGTDFQRIVSFHRVTFDEEREILFDGNLSKISFLNTTIPNKVKFGPNTKWNDDYKIFDEWVIDSTEEEYYDYKNKLFLGDILLEYNNLRENYEYHFKYQEAGKFFIRSSEMLRQYEERGKVKLETSKFRITLKKFLSKIKRRNEKNLDNDGETILKKKWRKRNLNFSRIYKLIGDYGESYLKPLGIVGGVFVVGWAYFTIICDWNLIICSDDPISYGVKRALAATTPYLSFDGTIEPLDYIIKATTLPFVGISFIALKRRFERKYRH